MQWGFAPVIWVVSPSYKVYKIAWWMAHYCALSPKRHMGLTNNVCADKLNKGKLTRKVRKGCTLKTTDRTRSKDGKVGYKGNRNLKSTQFRPQLMHESHVYSHSNRNNIVEFQTSLVLYIYIYTFQPEPRVYPQRFGVEVCKLMPKLKSEGEGQPNVSHMEPPAFELLRDTPMSDWPEANLKDVLRYLYSNKSLQLPPEWKQAFPKSI